VRVFFCVLFFVYIAASATVTFHPATQERVEGSYIIAFNKSLNAASVDAYTTKISAEAGVEVEHVYNFAGHFRAVHVKLTKEALLKRLQEVDHLDFIEENSVVTVGCIPQPDPIWNLQRLSYRNIPDNAEDPYLHPQTQGAGVTSYIIDTGVLCDHEEFETNGVNRCTWGHNGIDADNRDCNGHGTHVAGTVAGTLYGVAKLTEIVAVKVLNCQGSGTIASVMNGIEWVTNNHKKPANANMSLGGGNSAGMIQAVEASVQSGVSYICAAGNSNGDACFFSPANSPSAISVAATNIEGVGPNEENKDVRVYFSNFGRCTHILAPGTNVYSAWIPARTSYNSISGTSMAAPHVAGRISLLQGMSPTLTPAQLKQAVQAESTKGMVEMTCPPGNTQCPLTPNQLLHSAC